MRLSEWLELEDIRGDLSQYRPRVAALLRKYFKMSVELGRLPSLIGREFFRAQVTNYTTHTFEDAVIFVHDMERALEVLDPESQVVIARVIFQEYSYDEAADLLRLSRRTLARCVAASLDSLACILLDRGLMERTRDPRSSSVVLQEQPSAYHQPVSVRFLMTVRYPKLCQAPKFAEI